MLDLLISALLALLAAIGQGPAVGVATYYADAHQGQTMRNGEVFDMHDPGTCAANEWPLGTRLLVCHRDEQRCALVTVKDTGAFRRPNLVDLSYAAFGQLAPHSRGVLPVNIYVVGEMWEEQSR